MSVASRLCANVLLVAAVSLLPGCSADHPVEPPAPPDSFVWTPDTTWSDARLLAAAYTDSYTLPPGFYREPAPEYAAPYYVNTVSVAPLASRPMHWIELSTENVAQARAWAESTCAFNSEPTTVDPGEPLVTTRWLEFATTRTRGGPGVPMRAHRASYLDRSMYDRLSPGSVIGRFGQDVTPAHVRGLAEYLWFLDNRTLVGAKALASAGAEMSGAVTHSIWGITVVRGDFSMSDAVVLDREDFSVRKSDGAVTRRIYTLRTVRGRSR